MDFSSIFTTLWNKVSNPIPNVLIGIAITQFAPDEAKWFGYIFLAIGFSRLLEWLLACVSNFLEGWRRNLKIVETLRSLNYEEKQLLHQMLENNEQTISIVYQDYHRPMAALGPKGGRIEYVKLFGTCTGLQSKGLFVVGSMTEVTTYSLYPEVWKVMKKIYKKEPTLFETSKKKQNPVSRKASKR